MSLVACAFFTFRASLSPNTEEKRKHIKNKKNKDKKETDEKTDTILDDVWNVTKHFERQH